MMIVFLSGLLLFLLGAALLKHGAWPRRSGDTPHCRHCDYILSGLAGDPAARCPECGLSLVPGNVILGERHRARGPAATGTLLLLLAVATIFVAVARPFRSVNWYAYKLATWVIDDLDSANADLRDRAWNELAARRKASRLSAPQQARLDTLIARQFSTASPRLHIVAPDYLIERFPKLAPAQQDAVVQRLLAELTSTVSADSANARRWLDYLLAQHHLSPAHQDRLTETALGAQGDGRKYLALDWLLNYLGGRELASQLTPEQREQFFTACFKPTLDLRPDARAGEDLPYRVRLAGRGPANDWWSRVALLSTRIDDQPPHREGGSLGSSTLSGGDSSIGASLRLDAPGKHRFAITIEFAAADGPFPSDFDRVPPRWSRKLTLAAPFEILPPGAPDNVVWIDDPGLRDAIRKSIRPSGARASAASFEAFAMTVGVENPPANLAFDILARDAAGTEHPIGTLHALAGSTGNFGVNARKFPPGPRVGKVDLIFRSSDKVMKGTTDLYEAWRGEIVFENVPVQSAKN